MIDNVYNRLAVGSLIGLPFAQGVALLGLGPFPRLPMKWSEEDYDQKENIDSIQFDDSKKAPCGKMLEQLRMHR